MATFVTSDPAGYEIFMGRWTSRLAGPFLEFAGISPGQRVLRSRGKIGSQFSESELAILRFGANPESAQRTHQAQQ